MTVEKLYKYLSHRYEVTHNSRMFKAGTILEVRSIDIRKFKDIYSVRFRCDATIDGVIHRDIYLDAYEFACSIEYVLKGIN